MLGRFGKDAGSLLGIEITPPFIRLVQLRRRRGVYQLTAWALEPLPAAVMHNGWIGDPEQVGAALLRAVRQRVGRCRRVAVALPGALVIEKLMSLPVDLDDDAIAEHLSCEAGQFIPFALDDAAIDFQVIDRDPDDPQRQRVVVAACHQALLEVLQASLETAGMRACVVEADSHAVHRALTEESVDAPLVLQIEADTLVFHALGVEPVPLRREAPLNMQRCDAQALAAAVDNYLLAAPGRELPGQLLLLGAGALDRQLPKELQQRLGLDVRHADPFRSLPLAPALKSASPAVQAPCLVVACGLALREGDRCLD